MIKRMLSVVLTVAFSLGICGQAFAAGGYVNDPRFRTEGYYITYNNELDNTFALRHDPLIVMVNGSVLPIEGRYSDGTAYVPIKAVFEALGGTYMNVGDGSVMVNFNGATATVNEGSSVAIYNNKYYNMGAPIIKIDETLCAPVKGDIKTAFGDITLVKDSPFGIPAVVFDLRITQPAVNLDVRKVHEYFNRSVLEYHWANQRQEWYEGLGITYMKELVDELLDEAYAPYYSGEFSYYYVFKGDKVSFWVDKYSGHVFLVGDGFIYGIWDANLSRIFQD